ncbi:hypothetical protein [Actinoplanes teichomyceticus]|uniref:hypothetical protein n=1 Tax=Actinoplanes teichomyceticus TaxID=1867 RepID=UPI0011A6EA95|nr:hypothetical protein [Actinoplanes teichomyceticus]
MISDGAVVGSAGVRAVVSDGVAVGSAGVRASTRTPVEAAAPGGPGATGAGWTPAKNAALAQLLTDAVAPSLTIGSARPGAGLLRGSAPTTAAAPDPRRLKAALLTAADLPAGYVPMPDALKAFNDTGSPMGLCGTVPGGPADRPSVPDRPVAPGAPLGPGLPARPAPRGNGPAPIQVGTPAVPSAVPGGAPAAPFAAPSAVPGSASAAGPGRPSAVPGSASAASPDAPSPAPGGASATPAVRPGHPSVVSSPAVPSTSPSHSSPVPSTSPSHSSAAPPAASAKPADRTVRTAFMRGETGPVLIEVINPVGDRAAADIIAQVAEAPRRCPAYDEGRPGEPDALHMATYALDVPRFGNGAAGVRFEVVTTSPRVTVHGKMIAVSVRGTVVTVVLANLEEPGRHELEAITRIAVRKVSQQK